MVDKRWLIIALLAASLPVQAAQNLLQIYQQALARDPVWSAAQNANRAAQEKIVQGQAQYLPVVSIAGNANATSNDVKFVGAGPLPPNQPGARRDGRQNYEGYSLGLNIVQPIFRPQIRAQLEQAKSMVQQSDYELAVSKQNLILRSSQLYFDVLLAQDKIHLIEAQKQAISSQLEQARARFEAGTSTITDVNEDKARFDLIQAQYIAAVNDLEIKKRALQALIGDMPQSLMAVREDLVPQTPAPSNIEKWVEMANSANLRIAIQRQALEIAAQEVDRQNAGHLPSLDLVGSYTDSYVNGGIAGIGLDQRAAVIGMQLSVPIYQGGAVSSRSREALSNKLKAQDDLEAARRQADMETRQAYLNLVSTVSQISALEQALASTQSQLESTQLGYEVGVRTSVDVLNVQQQLFNAKRDLLQARYTYLMNILMLKAAVGDLTMADLEAVNQQLVATNE
ncbi:MAG: TolC family outer membrane protein [Candidatus Methylopumilus sp.]|jgi:outer membrane protein|nr:TolC family outer membrane protein [Candidatus Methylopumilus sp.]NBW60474.1 type I secretion protein TolC [Methylophilaceae bacterium]